MIRIILYLLISTVLAIALSLCTSISIPEHVLSTLYTVAGVIFSVGMSLTISPKTDKVANESIRKSIRKSHLRIRNMFMYFFGLDTVFFIIAEGEFISSLSAFFNILCGVFLLFSVAYYIFNFTSLQKLGEQIEDQVRKESKQ